MEKVIYIEKKQYLVDRAVENNLREAGFQVLKVAEDLEEVNRCRHEAEIFVYNPAEDSSEARKLVPYLASLCRDSKKSLCLLGSKDFLEEMKALPEGAGITRTYIAPVDMKKLAADVVTLAKGQQEYRRRKQVLIVDDDEDFLAIMTRWLKNAYDVEGLQSGEEALDYLVVEQPDLVLLDYEMPEMDGYEVMERIQKNPVTARIPIIFLTGINDRESVMRIIKQRPDGYILKSTKKAELLDTLANFFYERSMGKG
jgi:CheY-like chemotaxis protein